MALLSSAKTWLLVHHFRPRRWLRSFFAYRNYMGYIRPKLLVNTEQDYNIKRKILSKGWEPRALSWPVGQKILALSPHPDDESIGAGGILWAHRNVSEIHLIVFCKGEKGGAIDENIKEQNHYRSRLAEVRKCEFSQTARMLSAKSCYFLDYPDGNIPSTEIEAQRLRSLIDQINPDIVLIPWFFDNLPDHRQTNILYSLGCSDLELMVLAYEVWTLLEPNAFFDITDYIEGKCLLIKNYVSQLRTVDYLSYAVGLSMVRAFQYSTRSQRTGAYESYIALPNNEYCDLVQQYYCKGDSQHIP